MDGSLLAEAIYLLPFGIYASCSLLPDPLMVMWINWAAYCMYRWSATKTWKWALLAGITSGIAIFIMVFSVFPVAAMAIGLSLSAWLLPRLIKQPQIWAVAVIMIIIPRIYYLIIMGNKSPKYVQGWVLSFSGLWTKGWFYKHSPDILRNLINLTLVLAAAALVLLITGRPRVLLLGMWIGYLLIGMSVHSLIKSHSNYNLFIVPLVAIYLAPLEQLFMRQVARQSILRKTVFTGVALVGIFYPVWNARVQLVQVNYRDEILGWIKMGQEKPHGARIIGITQDYNSRLQYYGWVLVQSWPLAGNQQMGVLAGGNMDMNDPSWDTYFQSRIANADYFLIANMAELN